MDWVFFHWLCSLPHAGFDKQFKSGQSGQYDLTALLAINCFGLDVQTLMVCQLVDEEGQL